MKHAGEYICVIGEKRSLNGIPKTICKNCNKETITSIHYYVCIHCKEDYRGKML